MATRGRISKTIHFFIVIIVIAILLPASSASASNTPLSNSILASYQFLPSPNYTQNDEQAVLRIEQYNLPQFNIVWLDPQGTAVSCGSVCIISFEYSEGGTIIAATAEFHIAGRSLPSGTYTARVTYCTFKIGPTCISWSFWFDGIFTISDVGFPISGYAGVAGAILSYFDGTTKTVSADNDGNYTIIIPPGWSGTVTPSKPHYRFTPSSISYSDVQQAYSEQDYTATVIFMTFLPLTRR